MVTAAPPRPGPAPSAAADRPARARPSRLGAAALGAAFLILLFATLGVALAAFDGDFSSYATVTVALPASANAVAVGNPVDYRDVQVGTVSDVTAGSTAGAVRVVLHMDPSQLAVIPADVHAAAVPLSIFGTQYIDLEVPAGVTASATHLAAGQFIPASSSSGSSSLQTTVANIDDILTALHPADLASAFDALATALNGQGKDLGVTLARSAAYLGQLLPQLPTAEADLGTFGTVGTQLAAIAPALLQTTTQVTTTANTLNSEQTEVSDLLTGGTPLAQAADTLLSDIATPYQEIATDILPLLQDVSANPKELSETLSGFSTAAAAFTAAASHGPYLSASGTLAIQNSDAMVEAGLTSGPVAAAFFEQAVGPQNFNPTPYTAADCPTYGTWTGADCGGGSASARASGTGSGGASMTAKQATVGDTAVTDAAVDEVAAGLAGATPKSPTAATLMLAPLMAALATGTIK